MLRALVFLRSLYKYFSENKTWILSILFVCSIIRTCLWYALFGVNILSYSSLQDIFINFADYFMSLIYIGISYILCLFVRVARNPIANFILSALAFIVFFCLFNIVFRMVIPFLFLLLIISILRLLYHEKRIAKLYGSVLLILLLFTIGQPLEQFFLLKTSKKDPCHPTMSFIERPANYDIFSFEYSNMSIDTGSNQFYYIGGNTDYYFILNFNNDEVLIIPKSECSNIKGSPISIKKISQMYS